MSDGGKGDKQRPTDHAAFSDNFDSIFEAKPVKSGRGSFVWCNERQTFVSKDEYYSGETNNAPYIQGDIQPYQSMVNGEMITSRSQHREHLKQHNCFEIGNEIDHTIKTAKPEYKPDREALRRRIAEVMNSKRY